MVKQLLNGPFEIVRNVSIMLTVAIIISVTLTTLAAMDSIIRIANIAVWTVLSVIVIAILIGVFFAFQWLRRRHLMSTLETRARVAEVEKLEMEASIMSITNEGGTYLAFRDKAGYVIHAAHLQHRLFENLLPSGNVDDEQVQLMKWALFTSRKQKVVNELIEGAAPGPEVLNFEEVARKALASRGAGRFIAFGPMDSGKTTICMHAVDFALQEIVEKRGGKVVILDPHAPETVWAKDGITVIGAGLDYGSIRTFLDQMKVDIKARYEAGCGDDSRPLPAPPVFIICEEWSGILSELQAGKQWDATDNRAMYMDARKAGYGYFLVSHEHTVGALGLQGMGNLLNGVEYFVSLEKDAITGQHSATLGRSFKDKNPYELKTPGAYNGRMYYSDTQVESEKAKTDKYLVLGPVAEEAPAMPEFVVADPEPEPEPDRPTDAEMAIIEAVATVKMDNGKIVWSKVTGLLGWGTGGPNNDRVKAVLDKWDVSY